MDHEIKDITIIGGGPTGLFALFYAGMRGMTAQIIDALPEAGGQLTALYPEKYIFDVAGIPQVLAKDLVRSLVEQAGRFQQPIQLTQRVAGLAGRKSVRPRHGSRSLSDAFDHHSRWYRRLFAASAPSALRRALVWARDF